jgi:hypothetical protein
MLHQIVESISDGLTQKLSNLVEQVTSLQQENPDSVKITSSSNLWSKVENLFEPDKIIGVQKMKKILGYVLIFHLTKFVCHVI